MNIDELQFEKIVEYLDGQLPQKALASFETKMASDPVLQEQVRYVAALIGGVKQVSRRRKFTQLWEETSEEIPMPRTRIAKPWPIIGIAASLLLVTFLIWKGGGREGSEADRQLVQHSISPDLEFSSHMSVDPANLIAQIESGIINEDYANARKMAQELIEVDAGPYSQYLLGVTEVCENKFRQSLGRFEQAASSKDEKLSLRIAWWRALAHIGLGEYDLARELLREIEQSPLPFSRKAKAKELLREVEERKEG